MRQDIRFMIEAVPGRPIDATAAGGAAHNDARFTLALVDGSGAAEVTMKGETALSIAKGIINCLMRAGMDVTSVPSQAGSFIPMGQLDA